MAYLRVTDFNGSHIVIEVTESADEFNDRIDQAFSSRNYNIRLNKFTRMDVRNIAMIIELKPGDGGYPKPVTPEPETPAEEPEQPQEPQPEEPLEEEPTPEESTDEPLDEPETEPSEDK